MIKETKIAIKIAKVINFLVKFIFKCDDVDELKSKIKRNVLCKTKYKKKDIRMSIAYLIRIKIEDKYLLVKSNRIPNQYQPVGGVYKYKKRAEEFLESINYRVDDKYKRDNSIKRDLRIFVKGKNVPKLIHWFKLKEDRETDVYREFKEELLDTNIINNKDLFTEDEMDLKFERRIITPIKFSRKFKCNEILIREIYAFRPETIQKKELEKLLLEESETFKFFTYDDIDRLGMTDSKEDYSIGEHTLSILEGSTD